MPGTSPLAATATGLKNAMASVGPGWRPDLPQAARNRTEFMRSDRGKNGSSEITHDPHTLGYTMVPNELPNAELRSLRRAPVKKTRSRNPTSSCTSSPILTNPLVASFTVGMTPPGGDGLLVKAVRDIRPSHGANTEEARRPEICVEAAGEALDALGHEDIKGLVRREESVPVFGGVNGTGQLRAAE